MSNEQQIAAAKTAYEAAQQNHATVAKALADLKESQSHIAKAFEEAKKALDAGKPALTLAKAKVAKAEAELTIAKAELDALVPPPVNVPVKKGAEHSVVRATVNAMLAAAPDGLSVDAIFAGLQAQGVQMAGAKARENLNAYLSRWEETKNLGRGVWGLKQADVPAFLAPTGTEPEGKNEEVPSFLAEKPVEEPKVSDDLPEGFPGRQAFIDAGFATRESLNGKTHDQLRRIKGVGAETARLALEALGA